MARSYPKSTFTRSLPLHLWVGMLTRMWATRAIVRESVSQIMYMRVCICVYEREIQTETQCSKTAASLCNDINGNYKLNFHQGVATSCATYHWYPKMGHRDHLKKEGRPQIPMTTWKKKSNQSILGHPWKHNISSTFPKMFFMQLRLKLSQVRNKIKEKQTFGGDHIFCEDSAAVETGVLKPLLLLLLQSFTEGWPTEFLPHVHLPDSSLYYLNIFMSSDLILHSYQNESSKGINSKCEVASKSSYRSFPRAVRPW